MYCRKDLRTLPEDGGHNKVLERPKKITTEQRLLHLAIRKIFEERGFYR